MVRVSLVHIPRWNDGHDIILATGQGFVSDHLRPIKLIEFRRKILRIGNHPSPVHRVMAALLIIV